MRLKGSPAASSCAVPGKARQSLMLLGATTNFDINRQMTLEEVYAAVLRVVAPHYAHKPYEDIQLRLDVAACLGQLVAKRVNYPRMLRRRAIAHDLRQALAVRKKESPGLTSRQFEGERRGTQHEVFGNVPSSSFETLHHNTTSGCGGSFPPHHRIPRQGTAEALDPPSPGLLH